MSAAMWHLMPRGERFCGSASDERAGSGDRVEVLICLCPQGAPRGRFRFQLILWWVLMFGPPLLTYRFPGAINA